MKSTTSKQFSRPKFTWNGRETGSDHDPPEVRIEKLGRTMLRMSDLKKLSVQFKVLNSRKLTLLVNTRCILCRQRSTRQKTTTQQPLRTPLNTFVDNSIQCAWSYLKPPVPPVDIADDRGHGARSVRVVEDFISLTCLSPAMKCCILEIYEVISKITLRGLSIYNVKRFVDI